MKFIESIMQSRRFYYILVLMIVVLSNSPVIDNGWVNWDDNQFILDNFKVHHLSLKNAIDIFNPDKQVMDTYTPLPVLSFAFEYSLVKDNPQLYHINNLLLHLINTFLVLWLIFLLTSNFRVAVFTSLLFGFHPLHVESVAWITERKDVLMSLFFLLSCIFYLKFIRNGTKRKSILYLLTLLFFILAIFSKPQAASLPLLLVLFDWWFNRKFSWKLIWEKVPYFLLAIGIGLVSMIIVDDPPDKYAFFDRIWFSSFAFILYIYKFILPFDLNVIYDLPVKVNSYYPFIVYASLPISMIFGFLVVRSIRKNKIFFFGMLFFIINIALALHLFKLTTSIIYERYAYIPFIGLYLIFSVWIEKLLRKKNLRLRIFAFTLLGGVIILFSILSFNRSRVWENSESLWTDVINKQPHNYFPYNKRAFYYLNTEKYNLSMKDYNKCLELNPLFDEAYNNRGLLQKILGNSQLAFSDFSKALEVNSKFSPAMINLGILYKEVEDYSNALYYFDNAISVDPNNFEYYIHRGVIYKRIENYKKSIDDYTTAIDMNSFVPSTYYNRGFVYCLDGDFNKGISDFSKAIELQPDYANAWFERSIANYNIYNYSKALNDVLIAQKLGIKVDREYIEDLNKKAGL